jgi:predicted nucleotidyltransferase
MMHPNMGTSATTKGRTRPPPRRKSKASTVPLSLADALFTGTQQRVIGLLFGQPGRSFYANEVIALTRGGSGAVQRELARLAQAGLVTVRASGKQKYLQANPASPIFDELCSIARKTVGLAEPLRTALMPLAKRIRAAFVFGSIAKREDTASSDIDVMVLSDDVDYADLYPYLEDTSRALGRKINPTIYTSPEWEKRVSRGDAFLARVLAQPRIWLIGGDDALGV